MIGANTMNTFIEFKNMTTFTEFKNKRAEEQNSSATPKITDSEALYFLYLYLTGQGFFIMDADTTKEQLNTSLVHQILLKYSPEYREEYIEYTKSIGAGPTVISYFESFLDGIKEK